MIRPGTARDRLMEVVGQRLLIGQLLEHRRVAILGVVKAERIAARVVACIDHERVEVIEASGVAASAVSRRPFCWRHSR